ncbi:MAG: redox-regulated ATPase YchF [Acidobacteria bacterium RIFCSPLOWO2_02_FULL_59_13]|nr:MAG: redox-regulated ATPase YchF [Acidobacteria bacterium RIFCSPLOWO2_02_FULL_59_13]
MKCAIIGLPQVGKTSVFQILTRQPAPPSHRHGETQHIGVVPVPDQRLDSLAELVSAAKVTYATIEYADVAAVDKESLTESAYLAILRNMDALIHVVRAFASESVAHVRDSVDPLRDIANMDLDLIVSDLAVVENRLAKLEKDLKKMRGPDMEMERALLEKVKQWLETERPLREGEWTEAERKQLRGFSFLSARPMLLVLNVGEQQAAQMDQALHSLGLEKPSLHAQTLATAVCGRIEAELAIMPDSEAAEFMAGYNLTEPGKDRLIRTTLELLGLIVFFTPGEKETRAWMIPKGATALQAAGAIHSDIEKNFIRAEVIAWDKLLEAGGQAGARQKGILRLEGKEYVVQDGEVLTIRHTG